MAKGVAWLDSYNKQLKKLGADTIDYDIDGSPFKNWNNPSKWKADRGNVARYGAATLTGGTTEITGVGDDIADAVNDPRAVWDDITGKAAADKAAKDYKKNLEKIEKEIEESQGETLDQVEVGRGDLQGGLGQATDAVFGGTAGSLQALYGGEGRAAEALGAGGMRLADLYGGGLASGFTADPGYQFMLAEGNKNIMQNAAARGGRMSGDVLKALQAHGQGLASQYFDKYAQRQMSLAGAADQSDWARNSALANLYAGTGQQAANIYTGTGSQLAGLYSGTGQNLANIGMQGAQINAGLAQAKIGAMQPPPQNPNPSTLQQVGNLGLTAAGFYFGGPMGAAAANTAANRVLAPQQQQQGYYV